MTMPGPKKIRVLVVDDSLLFRKTLEERLSATRQIEIVGTAVDAMDAMAKIRSLRPDVVTLDVEMPKMNGIDFLKKLIPIQPIPVVVVSSLPLNVLDALSAGAVDFVRKPQIRSPKELDSFIIDLAAKIRIASFAHVRGHHPAASVPAAPAPVSTAAAPARPAVPLSALVAQAGNTVIAIGASTGGTEAILDVVRDLPATTPGVVIVQHMPPVFTKMYAQRLDKICKMRVKEAENGDRVEKGLIIIGAGEYHLRLAHDQKGYYVRSEQGPKVSGHCPSVDVLFDSVADVAGRNAVGVILTGMGQDGANGLLKMRKKGAYTIGQDKESCVVYGMPMVAYNIGGVQTQLPLDKIGGEIIRYLNSLGR